MFLMFLVAIVLFVICCFWYSNACGRKSKHDHKFASDAPGNNEVEVFVSGTILVACIIFIVVGGIWWGISFGQSIGKNAKMGIFHQTTLANYKYAIEATSQINIKSDNLLNDPNQKSIIIDLGKLTHQNMAQTVGVKIDTLVQQVNEYNTWLALMRKYDSNWFFDAFYEDPDPNLQFITLQMPKN